MKTGAGLVVVLLCFTACRKKEASAIPVPTKGWLEGELPQDASASTPVAGGTFTIRIHTEPAGLNLLHDQMAEATVARITVGPLYETLAEFDRGSSPRAVLKPLLAESWAESADHLALTIKLREGIKFHDGQSFSSKDVKAVVDAILEPSNLTTSMRSVFTDLASVATPDERTVVFVWKKAHFLTASSVLTGIPILPASALKGDFNTLAVNRAPIGTGPFRFASWETGKQLTYVRNEDYWGAKAWLAKVVIRIVKDETLAASLWERGEFDLMTRIPPAVWRSIEAPTAANAWAISGYHRTRFVENNYSWIGWNEERPFFADPQVRRALAMLYPAAKVAKNVDLEIEPSTTCPYYRFSESCDPRLEPYPYDPRSAARLLETAGWVDTDGDGLLDKSGVAFKFSFLLNPRSVRVGKLVALLQEELKKAGVQLEIEQVDAAQYIGRLAAHQFDAASLGWSTAEPERDNFQIFHSSQKNGGSNYVSYESIRADALLEQIRLTFDPVERRGLERKLHQVLYEEEPYLFLTNRTALDAAKISVRGLRPSLGWYDLRAVWLAAP